MSLKHQPGEIIGNYCLVEFLGEGSFGEAWKAEHQELSNKFEVFKFPKKTEFLDILRQEGETLHRLNHPSIVSITDMSTQNGGYLRMEYIPGETLEKLLKRELKISWARCIPLLKQLLEVLEALHNQNVIHRDLKPANIFVSPEDIVKVSDFGLAFHTVDGSLSGCFQESEEKTGSWDYMAPEGKSNPPEISPASDIYSLGVIAYEMLTGHKPSHLVLPSHFSPDCPAWLDSWVASLLLPLAERKTNFSELQAALNESSANETIDKETKEQAETLSLPEKISEKQEHPSESKSIFARFYYHSIFGLGVISLALGWVVLRAPMPLIIFTLIAFLLIEISRQHIYHYWPSFLFWSGLILVFSMARLPIPLLFGVLLIVISISWWLRVTFWEKERS